MKLMKIKNTANTKPLIIILFTHIHIILIFINLYWPCLILYNYCFVYRISEISINDRDEMRSPCLSHNISFLWHVCLWHVAVLIFNFYFQTRRWEPARPVRKYTTQTWKQLITLTHRNAKSQALWSSRLIFPTIAMQLSNRFSARHRGTSCFKQQHNEWSRAGTSCMLPLHAAGCMDNVVQAEQWSTEISHIKTLVLF